MKLVSLSVRNFRSVESLEIKEFGEVNTFFGPNNSGKSNILAAIRFGIYGAVEQFDRVHFGSVNVGNLSTFDIFQNDPARVAKLTLVLSLESSDKMIMKEVLALEKPYDFTDDFSEDNITGASSFTVSRTLTIRENGVHIATPEASLDSKDILKIEYKAGNAAGKNLRDLFGRMIEGSFQNVFAFRKFSRETDDSDYRTSRSAWIAGENMKKALFNLRHSETPADRKNFEEISKAFSLPPFSYGKLSVVRSQEPSTRDELKIMVSQGHFEVPIQNLGSGPQQVLMLLTNVLRRRGHILAIEEPECNLSPESQREFAKKLTEYASVPDSPIGQLLISTHSSAFGFQGRRFMVRHDGTRTVLKEVTSNEDEKEVHDHFAPLGRG